MNHPTFPLLYSHPTKLIFLDDAPTFLRNIELVVGRDSLYGLFDDAEECLSYLARESKNTSSLLQRAISFHENYGSDTLVYADFGEIENEPTRIDRFSIPTCVVVDYQMPSMNGIDFCKQISNPHIGKILLTGVADTNVAINAFNEGTIDRFVEKGADNAMDLTLEYAKLLQEEYFAKQQNSLISGLTNLSQSFGDRILSEHMATVLKENGCVEHYISNNPTGYIGITASGKTMKFVTLSQDDLNQQVNYAHSQQCTQQYSPIFASWNSRWLFF